MIPPKPLFSVLIALTISPLWATAQTKVAESKDWSLWEVNQNGVDTCYAQVMNKAVFRSEDFVLEISKAKNKANSPVEVLMRIQKNKKESTGLVALVSNGTQLGFSDLTGTKELFWAAPKDLSKLIEQLRADQELPAKTVGGKKEIDFSISSRGFKDIISEMEKRCNAGAGLVDTSFEAELLANVSGQVDPTRLDSGKTTQVRAAYFAAFSLHSQKIDTQKGLQKVLDKYKPLTDELARNRAENKQITQVDLPTSQKTLVDAQKAQVDLTSEIKRLEILIPQQTHQVTASQKSLDEAQAILAPLVPEHSRLVSQLRSAQRSLSEAQSRLADLDSRLQELSNSIAQLSAEATNLERFLPSKRSELDRAISNLRDAEFRRSQFNVRNEIDRRLRNNGEYQRIISERQSIDGQLSSIQGEISRLQAERQRVARDLEACRASGQGGDLVPVPPTPGVGGGLTPGLVAADSAIAVGGGAVDQLTPVVVDCSVQEQALQRADQMLNEKQTLQRNLSNRRSDLDRAIDNAERSTENEVRREYDMLVNREDQARQEFRRWEDEVQRDQSRVSQIRSIELPRLSDEQRALTNERPSVVSRISQSKSQVDRSQKELAQFNQANDWDRKAADVDAKQKKLSADQALLAQSVEAKTTAERRLARAIETEAKMKTQIEQLNARIVALNSRAVELEAGLKKLPAERAPFDAKLASLQKDLNAKKEEILNLLRS